MKGGINTLREKINELNDEIRRIKAENASLEVENRKLKSCVEEESSRAEYYRINWQDVRKRLAEAKNWEE